MGSRIQVDDDLWPLVMVRWLAEGADEDDYRAMFERYLDLYAKRERFYTINDTTRNITIPNAKLRGVIAELSREHEPDSIKWGIGSSVIVTNAVLRGGLTAVTWLAPPKYRLHVASNMDDAMQEAIDQLRRDGARLPPALLAQEQRLIG